MKKILTTFAAGVCCVMISAVFTACSNDDNPLDSGVGVKKIPVIIKASMDDVDVAKTRGLIYDGTTLVPVWKKGDKVYVERLEGDGNYTYCGDLFATNVSSDGYSCDLRGELNCYEGQKLRLRYNDYDYLIQEGTLEYIGSNCLCAVANVVVERQYSSYYFTGDAVFENQEAIIKFKIIKGGLPYRVSRVVITSASGKLLGRIDRNGLGHNIYGGVVIDPIKRSSEMYAAIRNESDEPDTYTFNAFSGPMFEESYSWELKDVKLEYGNYYVLTLEIS